jgi:D-tyrosyl-tRNA(Tyr) deacylase
MRAVVQRVSSASVRVDGRLTGAIEHGLLVLLGVGSQDGAADVEYVAAKIRELRIFPDAAGKMNRDVADAGGAVLLVSQFTLFGDARNGRRPSFIAAAPPELASALYEGVAAALAARGLRVETGEFGAHMDVSLVNDGPVTILLDSTKAF